MGNFIPCYSRGRKRDNIMPKDHEEYERLKAEHRCVYCWKQDERTLRGLTRCQSCYEKDRQYGKQYDRDTYQWRIKNHYCGRCGEKDAYTMNGRSLCAECAEKDAERKRKKFGFKPRDITEENETKCNIPAIERPSYGLCFFCGKPLMEGMTTNYKPVRTCPDCYKRCARIGTINLGRATV